MIFKILIIEDDKSVHLLYHMYFKKIIIVNVEIKYMIVSNLDDAKIQCNIFEPDCILLDLNLNGIQMHGLNISNFYDIDKCIIISGLLDSDIIIKCNSLGFFKFIHKPFNFKFLEIVINKFYMNYKLYLDLANKDEHIRRKFQENMILVDDLQDQYYLQDSILSIIPVIIYIKDTNLKYITVNNKFLEINNIDNINAIIGKTDYDIFDFERAKKYSDEDQNVIYSNKPLIDMLNTSHNRIKFEWTSTSKYPLHNIGVIGIIIDVTSSIKLEKIVENTFNAIKDGICIIDFDNIIIKTNKILEEWYSDQMPLVGKKCIEVFNDMCEMCPNKSEYINCEIEYNQYWFKVEYYPIKDTSYIICYRRNITDRKLLEKEKQKKEDIYKIKLKEEINNFKLEWVNTSSEFDKNILDSNTTLSSIDLELINPLLNN